jgi:hypothetical protein
MYNFVCIVDKKNPKKIRFTFIQKKAFREP